MNRAENEGCKLALAPLVESMSYAMQTLIISLVRARASWCIGRKLLWDPSIGLAQDKRRLFAQPMLRVVQRKL